MHQKHPPAKMAFPVTAAAGATVLAGLFGAPPWALANALVKTTRPRAPKKVKMERRIMLNP
jgi:hypothetical protein